MLCHQLLERGRGETFSGERSCITFGRQLIHTELEKARKILETYSNNMPEYAETDKILGALEKSYEEHSQSGDNISFEEITGILGKLQTIEQIAALPNILLWCQLVLVFSAIQNVPKKQHSPESTELVTQLQRSAQNDRSQKELTLVLSDAQVLQRTLENPLEALRTPVLFKSRPPTDKQFHGKVAKMAGLTFLSIGIAAAATGVGLIVALPLVAFGFALYLLGVKLDKKEPLKEAQDKFLDTRPSL